jgi:hypothetical protein
MLGLYVVKNFKPLENGSSQSNISDSFKKEDLMKKKDKKTKGPKPPCPITLINIKPNNHHYINPNNHHSAQVHLKPVFGIQVSGRIHSCRGQNQ